MAWSKKPFEWHVMTQIKNKFESIIRANHMILGLIRLTSMFVLLYWYILRVPVL